MPIDFSIWHEGSCFQRKKLLLRDMLIMKKQKKVHSKMNRTHNKLVISGLRQAPLQIKEDFVLEYTRVPLSLKENRISMETITI